MLKTAKIAHIQYTKSNTEEVTERFVIPTFVPSDNIKAIDVTSLSESERATVEELYKEYVEYYTQAASRIFNFEDWVSHTGGDQEVDVKWRTFKAGQIKDLD